ncbi:Putative leucine-rich repeat domain superfamily [Septoria linicola]|uniref:Leucine-rich repeat domain superfamily n=1 Tax=Septoria linicola TaxID=215465 RepID=A0A9Q9B6K6_9PEZI|nr:Putative leucine-rich repeat domain superfamily [Septoria linicola]
MAASETLEGQPLSMRWAEKIRRQGGAWDPSADPLSLQGASSLPMPVEISDKASLAPFFEFLSNDGKVHTWLGGLRGTEPAHSVPTLEFKKGVAYEDGRIDLCKMATGPRNIGELMQALDSYKDGKHFLLGNNIIGPTGAKTIAAFIDRHPTQFETWYLAGNCIDMYSIDVLIDAMIRSPVITNVWLKRNDLRGQSYRSLAKLIMRSPYLRTLDLDQTSLSDGGVGMLFRELNLYHERYDWSAALRHIYLNATGAGQFACTHIAKYLKHSRLESLHLSCNPIGKHIPLLAAGIRASTTLTTLTLQSCGLGGDDTATLLDAVKDHPSLRALDLGQSYATEDLRMSYNWLDGDKFETALLDLVTANGPSQLRYLNLGYTPMTCSALNKIYPAVIANKNLVYFKAAPLVKGGRTKPEIQAGLRSKELLKDVRERLRQIVAEQYNGMSYEEFEEGPKRFLLSPPDVRYIDSVCRNRDSALAKRGLKILDKWWAEDDGTLQNVHSGIID